MELLPGPQPSLPSPWGVFNVHYPKKRWKPRISVCLNLASFRTCEETTWTAQRSSWPNITTPKLYHSSSDRKTSNKRRGVVQRMLKGRLQRISACCDLVFISTVSRFPFASRFHQNWSHQHGPDSNLWRITASGNGKDPVRHESIVSMLGPEIAPRLGDVANFMNHSLTLDI